MAATLAQCQQLVTQFAGVFGQAVLQQSLVAKCVYREYQQSILAGGAATTLNLTDKDGGALAPTVNDLTDVTATLPVARLLADGQFFASTVTRLARKLGDVADAALLGLYNSIVLLPPVGTPGTPLTEQVVVAAWSSLSAAPLSEARYLAVGSAASQALTVWTNSLNVANGGAQALAIRTNGYAPKVFGLIPVVSPQVPVTGITPPTTHNLAFAQTALALISCRRTLTNDSTHVQAYSVSTDGTLGVTVYLNYDGGISDSQLVGFGIRGQALVARTNYAVQVSC